MKWFTRWEFFALASAFFAGLTAFLGKMGVMNVNSNLATFIRTLVILVMTACILSWRHQWQWPQGTAVKAWVCLVLSGIATGLSWLCYYRALQLGPASKVAPVDKFSVVLVMLGAVIFFRETLTWKTAMGGALITAGVILTALP